MFDIFWLLINFYNLGEYNLRFDRSKYKIFLEEYFFCLNFG